MRRLVIGLAAVISAFLFPNAFSGSFNDIAPPALADPALSGAESVQVVNGDFSGAGSGEVGTPPANYDFETPGGTVGTPPSNYNFSTGNFADWTLTGSPTIQSGGPGGYYAQLASGQKIKSSAFTVASTAQALTVNVAAVSGGTFQWKFNIWSGAGYSTKTPIAFTSCPTTCTNWNAYSIDAVPWAGSSIKVEVERYLGDLKTDDVAVGQEILPNWTPAAGDKITRQTGGPSGAYAKTTTTITSAAFTLDANAQNGTADFKVESASGSYNVYVRSGAGYTTETHVFYGEQADSSTWGTKTFAVGSWAGQSIKLKIAPAANTTLLVDRVAVARNEISGWTSTGSMPMSLATEGGFTYLKSYSTIRSQFLTLDYQSYYGNTRVNWFRIVYRHSGDPNLQCQGAEIGSTLNVYFAGGVSPFFGASGKSTGPPYDPIGVWIEKFFYIYNPSSPYTPSPQTGWIDITGWPNPPTLPSCQNAKDWDPPSVAVLERIDAPPVTDCASQGAMADELNSKPVGASTRGVDVVSGNYFRGHTDLSIPGKGLPLRFTRCYSAQSKTGGLGVTGPLGNKWSHNWQASIKEFDLGNHAIMRLPGGATLVWRKFGGSFLPPPGFEGTLVKNEDGTFTLTTWHKLVYTFDAGGKLTSIKDRNATPNSINLTYDGYGRLSTITAPGSRSLTLGYNAENRISTLSDSAGRSVSYGYNTATGDLTSVQNALTGITSYQYSGHLLTQATDPNSHLSVRNTYDGRIRVTQQLDPLGAALNISYSTPGNGATRVTDPKGYQTTYYFDTSMRITDVMNHNGGVTTTAYDSDNNRTTVTNPLLKSWTTTYDINGNVLSLTDPMRQPNGAPESGVPGCGNLDTGNGEDNDGDQIIDDGCPNMKSTYTIYNDPDLQTDPLGRRVDYIYNSTGNLTRLARLDSSGAVKALTCFEVESTGLVTASVQPTDLLVPASPTDPCTGNKTLYGYDAAGNQTCVVNARFSSTTTCATSPGRKATFIYDLAGRVIYTTNEITNNVRPVVGAAPETGGQCGADGTGNTADDDGDGTNDDGCPSVSYTYDALGDLLTFKDGLGNTTSNIYDLMGHLTKSTDANRQPNGVSETGSQCGPLGTGNGADDETPTDGHIDDGCPSVIYSYDNADRLIEVIDAIGGRTTYGYDAAGNTTSITSPRAPIRPVGANGPEKPDQCGPTGFGDGQNNDASGDDSIADDGCPSTIYAYDTLHRLQSETDALNHTTSYQYDAASNPQQRTDARNLVTKYFPDAANRPDYIEHWNGPTLVDTIDFTLDIAGRRTQLSDPSGVTNFAYDAMDRVTSVTFPGPKVVSYEYDKPTGGNGAPYPGQRTKITYPDSKAVTYTYLADGSMDTVTDWLTKQTVYTYDDAGRLTKTQYPNTVWTDYTYDSADRLLTVVNKKTGPITISSFTYTMDAVGNRTQMVDTSGTNTYQYDALHQLKQVTYPGPQTDTYTYDANGNRLTKNSTNYTNNAADQLTCSWSGPPIPACPVGSLNYGPDNNGNQSTRGADTFQYDHENQLTQSVISGATSSSVYNGDGLRLSHTVSGQTTNYTWDIGGMPLVLQDGTNTYVYGLSLISATDSVGVQTYFLYDGLGSTSDLTNGSGSTIATYTYDVFGAIRSQTGGSANYWLFTGEQRDSDASLYYLRARYYDPSIGRFLSMDPLGEGNSYSYVLNNPVNFMDPYGLLACEDIPWEDIPFIEEDDCEQAKEAVDAVVNFVESAAETIANAAESCWEDTICRTIGVYVGVAVCTAITSPSVVGLYACPAIGAAIASYEEAIECMNGSTVSCVNVGVNVGIAVAFARPVEWYPGTGKNWGFAPFGNSKLRIFHLHRRVFDPANPSVTLENGALDWHLPWGFLHRTRLGGNARWRFW